MCHCEDRPCCGCSDARDSYFGYGDDGPDYGDRDIPIPAGVDPEKFVADMNRADAAAEDAKGAIIRAQARARLVRVTPETHPWLFPS